jgi:ribosome maturation factor RimP
MSEPEKQSKPKRTELTADEIEAATMMQLCREAVESLGFDAVLVTWTRQRRRRTTISTASLGNGLAVEGLMRAIHAKIEALDDDDDDGDDDSEESERDGD